MKKTDTSSFTKAAIIAMAEIKAAVETFDRGEANVFDALDAIIVEIEAYRAADRPGNSREAA